MSSTDRILRALDALDPKELDYSDWLKVGMALHHEGFPVEVWEDWSRRDPERFHESDCADKYRSFGRSSTPVTGASIMQMAKGKIPFFPERGGLEWNSEISYEGTSAPLPETGLSPVEQLKTYIKTLFKPGDIVGFVTNDVALTDGRWFPRRGEYSFTAGSLLESLDKHPDDIGATVGDWKDECGGWIRFNPLDGNGVRNENVKDFRYALVESDSLSLEQQAAVYRKYNLPVAALVSSGGKSLHAIVRIFAKDAAEYRKRVEFLFSYLEKHGVEIDRQNKNPSRLSRMPGLTRNGKMQSLLAVNQGAESFEDWMSWIETAEDGLPSLENLSEYIGHPPVVPDELIEGILRCGHKMLISGSSKAGKSFLLMELCIAIAEGVPWLGFNVKKGRVLYVNLEIDGASCINRFLEIYAALGLEPKHAEDIVIWNLRGRAVPLDKLVPKLTARASGGNYSAIIVDPIYKVITGDENSASEMAFFCNQFDRICTETGCSVIYCHHHSKGLQGSKRAMDRASGSGVFARDPDAQLDMIQLAVNPSVRNYIDDPQATAWRLESNLREFGNIVPLDFWFEYPLHRVDTLGLLRDAAPEGSSEANLGKSPKRTSPDERLESLRTGCQVCAVGGETSVKDLADYLECTERTVRNRIKEFPELFSINESVVKMVDF